MPSSRPHPLLGVALVVATTLCFAALDNTARWLGRHLPVILFFWVRYAVQAAAMMPFLYLQIGFSTLLGVAVFAQWPDRWSLAGMAIIAASGAATAWLNLRGRPPPPPVVADAVGD